MAKTIRVRVPGPEGEPSEVVSAKVVGASVVEIRDNCFEDNAQGLQYGDRAHVVTGADGFPETAGKADEPTLLSKLTFGLLG